MNRKMNDLTRSERHLRLLVLFFCVAYSSYSARLYGQSPPTGATQTYTTNFPLTESAISESGKWIDGGTVGLDWSNVSTTAGLAFGTEDGSGGTNDSTAVLTGTWANTQMACATVSLTLSTPPSNPPYEEVELRLLTTITAHSITGYEITFEASAASNAYIQIVRWNGPLNSYDVLGDGIFAGGVNGPGIKHGDKLCAWTQAGTINFSINGTVPTYGGAPYSITDTKYTSGSPGIGFFCGGDGCTDSGYGFSSFTGSSFGKVAAPASHRVVVF